MKTLKNIILAIQRNQVAVTFLACVMVYAVVNVLWGSLNRLPLIDDEARHLNVIMELMRELKGTTHPFESIVMVLRHGAQATYYHAAVAFLSLYAGFSYVKVMLFNMLYFVLLLCSVHLISKKIFYRPSPIYAVIFIALYPMIMRYSRACTPDLAVTAIVSFSMYVLLMMDGFRKRMPSIFFGCVLGWGMLCTNNFFVYLIGPVGYTVWHALQFKKVAQRDGALILNAVLSILTAAVVALPFLIAMRGWGAGNVPESFGVVANATMGASQTSVLQQYLTRAYFYLFSLMNEQVSFLFFIALLVALMFCLKEKKKYGLLIAWWFVPYLYFTLSGKCDGRLMLPTLPVIALVTARGLYRARGIKFSAVTISAFIALGIFQFFSISFNHSRTPEQLKVATAYGDIMPGYFPTSSGLGAYSYGPPVKDAIDLNAIGKVAAPFFAQKTVTVGILAEEPVTSEILALSPGLLKFVLSGINEHSAFNTFNSLDPREVRAFIKKAPLMDCFIFISKETTWPAQDKLLEQVREALLLGHSDTINDAAVLDQMKNFIASENMFELIDTVALENGFTAHLYSNKGRLLRATGMSMFVEDAGAKVIDQNREALSGSIATSFNYQGNTFRSSAASWTTAYDGEGRMIAYGQWAALKDLRQRWTFTKDEKGGISFDIGFDMGESLAKTEIEGIEITVEGPLFYEHLVSLACKKIPAALAVQHAFYVQDQNEALGGAFFTLSFPAGELEDLDFSKGADAVHFSIKPRAEGNGIDLGKIASLTIKHVTSAPTLTFTEGAINFVGPDGIVAGSAFDGGENTKIGVLRDTVELGNKHSILPVLNYFDDRLKADYALFEFSHEFTGRPVDLQEAFRHMDFVAILSDQDRFNAECSTVPPTLLKALENIKEGFVFQTALPVGDNRILIIYKKGGGQHADFDLKNIAAFLPLVNKYGSHLVIRSHDEAVSFRDGALFLFHKTEPLLKSGVKSHFYYEGRQFDSNTAVWELLEKSETEMVVRGTWQDLQDMSQIWHVSYDKNGDLAVNMIIIGTQDLPYEKFGIGGVEISATKEFSLWATAVGSGAFDNETNKVLAIPDPSTRFFTLVRPEKSQPLFVTIEGNKALETNLLKVFSNAVERWVSFIGALRKIDTNKALLSDLKFRVTPQKNALLRVLGEQRKFETQRVAKYFEETAVIFGDSTFFFDHGKGRLLFEGKELTNYQGLHTAVRVNGEDYSSHNALWQVKRLSATALQASGRFDGIPIEQIWNIDFVSKNKMRVEILLDTFEDIELREGRTSLMMIDDYASDGLKRMTYSARSADIPEKIKFIEKGSDICQDKASASLAMSGSSGEMLQYVGNVSDVIKKGSHMKFFEGEIEIIKEKK